MLAFTIRHTTPTDERVTEVHVSGEWKIFIFVAERVVEISRSDASDEVGISGRLTLQNLRARESDRVTASDKVFSRFMKVGSTSVKICFGNVGSSNDLQCSLSGELRIYNITQNCITECRKCVSLVKLSDELGGMLDPQTNCFADVQLKCGSKTFPAHKNILSARSDIFAAMFQNSMRESLQNEVEIDDINESVLEIMLKYIYTGKTNDLTVSFAEDLLFAADKYHLQDLKRVCCEFLKDNLSLQNALSILVFGDQHSENELKYAAMNYICNECKKFSDLEETEEWKTILKERSALAMEILISVVKSRDQK